jgi:hypothetical protein
VSSLFGFGRHLSHRSSSGIQLSVTPSLAAIGVAWALGMGLLGGLLPALRGCPSPRRSAPSEGGGRMKLASSVASQRPSRMRSRSMSDQLLGLVIALESPADAKSARITISRCLICPSGKCCRVNHRSACGSVKELPVFQEIASASIDFVAGRIAVKINSYSLF